MGNKKKALLISCFDWADDRLRPVSEILIEEYKSVLITADFDHLNKCYVDKKEGLHYIHVPSYRKNISISRIRSHLAFSQKIGKILQHVKPDLIYCLVPPNSVGNVCGEYKKKHPEVKLFVDVIDMWPESMPLSRYQNFILLKYWKSLRNSGIAAADHVFLECALYEKNLKSYVSEPSKISVLHLFKTQTIEQRRLVEKSIHERQKRNGIELDLIKLAYVGSINNIIDIEGICIIATKLMQLKKNVEINIIGDGESRDGFIKALEKSGCIVNYYGKIFDEEKKIEILGTCDYALNMMKDSVTVGLTIKSIDYFSYGLPIINNIKGDTWNLVEVMRIGINVQNSSGFELASIPGERVLDVFDQYFTKEVFQKNVMEGMH